MYAVVDERCSCCPAFCLGREVFSGAKLAMRGIEVPLSRAKRNKRRRCITRVHSSDVRAERAGVTMWVHLPKIEIIRALIVTCEFGIVLLWSEDQWSTASPSPHELRCDQLLFVLCLAMLPKKIAKCS